MQGKSRLPHSCILLALLIFSVDPYVQMRGVGLADNESLYAIKIHTEGQLPSLQYEQDEQND